ncbi:suppressor of fused domain protein [Tropicibacter alexandrii]|uniref:suppressor of fused domain protein n=1 Tax=Tropicibacter alexandrii TaxID=2267683 RepID=UPI000EF45AFB|nr:suppressor of fused domain protein [Tropicibacter alexandrii]
MSRHDMFTRLHVAGFFQGHEISRAPDPEYVPQRMSGTLPGFHVLQIGPGPQTSGWAYVTQGLCQTTLADGDGLELCLVSPEPDARNVECLFMLGDYLVEKVSTVHFGQTFDIGAPWLSGLMTHLLLSKPYPFGPDLEIAKRPSGYVHHLWVLPIHKAEADFLHECGDLDALEDRFDVAGIDYLDPWRAAVV